MISKALIIADPWIGYNRGYWAVFCAYMIRSNYRKISVC